MPTAHVSLLHANTVIKGVQVCLLIEALGFDGWKNYDMGLGNRENSLHVVLDSSWTVWIVVVFSSVIGPKEYFSLFVRIDYI